jgi:hypothetical protein
MDVREGSYLPPDGLCHILVAGGHRRTDWLGQAKISESIRSFTGIEPSTNFQSTYPFVPPLIHGGFVKAIWRLERVG